MSRQELIDKLNNQQIYVDLWDDKFAIINGIFYLPDGDYDLLDESVWADYALNKMVQTRTL
jgi:hypothetical protein